MYGFCISLPDTGIFSVAVISDADSSCGLTLHGGASYNMRERRIRTEEEGDIKLSNTGYSFHVTIFPI